MTLGQKIFELRNKQKMSQGDLAEKLNVSRQSISKWETDASVPELDKLILLSDLFNITIDELVRDELPEKDTDGEKESTEKSNSEIVTINKQINTQKVIGGVLLGAGILSIPLILIFQYLGAVFTAFIFISSIICLKVKRHAGLIIFWILTAIVDFYFEFASAAGLIAPLIYDIPAYIKGYNYFDWFTTVISLCIWIVVIILTVLTVRAVKRKKT